MTPEPSPIPWKILVERAQAVIEKTLAELPPEILSESPEGSMSFSGTMRG